MQGNEQAVGKDLRRRARGALAGCAVGDAMGMPTELMSREDLAIFFPDGVQGFADATERDVFGRTLKAGEVTDDTLNTVLVARMLAECEGEVDSMRFIAHLQRWIVQNAELAPFVFGSNTLRALKAIERGESIERSGIFGTTNGGAMKITPLGVVYNYRNLVGLVDAVEAICKPTHNTHAAIACACAVAAGVSYAVRGGADLGELWDVALEAADEGWQRGYAFPTASVPVRMGMAREMLRTHSREEALGLLTSVYGTGVESVETAPAVFSLATLGDGDPLQVARLCAGVGGDTDTIGALATAICAAMHPDQLPEELVEKVVRVNGLELDELADSLAALAR